jgi:hypothetical protein
MAFPPTPVYPKGYDDDYTLYLVYNTTETKLASDNSPWAQEIQIVPAKADRPEIWADNGFGNINGELFYYDSVEKDDNGKVNKLKGCARQMGGDKTKFNKRGTWVRSYVVAEHHNQLVDAIMKTQDFIGYQFTPEQRTLDWRIRNLQALSIIFDDFSCPDINFTFNILEDDPITGVLAEYLIEITPPGTISSFTLDFGDGESTSTEPSGQHRYAVNATIDPVVSASNDKCQIIQTPIERANPSEPVPQVVPSFTFVPPESPEIPDFTFVPCDVPEQDINLPPLVTPCVSIEGQIGPIPSVITGPNINLVSNVVITGPTNPVNITEPVVSIVGGSNIPPVIVIDPPIPPTIIIDPPIPPTIIIVPPDSNITMGIDFTEMPRLEVDWGEIPQMEVALTMAQQVKTPQRFANDPKIMSEFGEEFADLFEINNSLKVEYEPVGIPSEIVMIPPSRESMTIDTGDLFQKKIQIELLGLDHLESLFKGLEKITQSSIRINADDVPEDIDLVYRGAPIPVEVTGMPKTVTVEMEKTIPERVIVEIPKPLPEKIVIEHNIPDEIIYVGPKSIPIEIPDDVFIPVRFPENMPEMVVKVAPIEVKITMDEIVGKTEEGRNCFMMVPCAK